MAADDGEGGGIMRGTEALARLRTTLGEGGVIVGAGAGTGLSAKAAADGGADLIIVYNSGRFRMAGRGSLAGLMPYGDANAIVLEMAREVIPVVGMTPVLAGVCGTDPFRDMSQFLDSLTVMGFAGVQNFPTVGLIDGVFRQNLEETGMGYELEVEMIAQAHRKRLLTAPYVFDQHSAQLMTQAGADVLVIHLGLTAKGSIGARTSLSMDQAVETIQGIEAAIHEVRDDAVVLFHGGPVAEPDDIRHVMNRTTGTHGFFGASAIERIPTEKAIRDIVGRLKNVKVAEGTRL
jgi:predicted TIM-barrel enzyme